MEIWEVINIQQRRFHSHDSAVIGLPIYLTVVAVVLGFGLLLLSGSLQDVFQRREKEQCEETLNRVLNEAAHLNAYASVEATTTMTLTVPGSIRLLVFGGLPTTEGQIFHDSRTSTNYYYIAEDGSVWTGHVQARLCGANVSCPAVFTPGMYHLTLKLLETEEGAYVAIWG
jgi:type II secretory pathway pseudopilin PulG